MKTFRAHQRFARAYDRRPACQASHLELSFVRAIATDADGSTIVSAVIGLGINLKLRIIVEGVDTPEQLVFLRTKQCLAGQGFLFSQPLPADDFARLMADQTPGKLG